MKFVCEDILSHFSDVYQIVQNTIYEDDQEEDNKCHREGDSGGVSEMRCLQSVGVSEMRCLQSVGVSEMRCLQSVGVSEMRWLQSVGVSEMRCLQSVGVNEMRCLQSVGVSEMRCLQSVGVSEMRCLQSVGVTEMICLQSVKIEDEEQQSNDQENIEPFAQISTAIKGVNKFVDVKQESKLDFGARSRSNEDTRHWIVCSGNVLKEVKAEQTVSTSATECGENLYEKQQQCKIHNSEETETNWNYVKSSASGLSLTQSSQLETDEDANKLACDTCGTSFTMSGSLEVDTSCHRRVKTYTCHLCTALHSSQCEIKTCLRKYSLA